jgi:3-oxoacyl-[acyl-carrier protein] reductase
VTGSGAFSLAARSAVVTGAASGIGRATAAALAEAGARLVLADVDGPGLAEIASELSAVAVQTDVARRTDVERLVDRALAEHGRLDVMANVAGILHRSPVLETAEADLDRVLAVNLKGVFFGCQAAGSAMAEAGGGSIVNIASSAAFQAHEGLASYSVSKAGVVALTRVLARELGPRGVRVNAIAPGMIETPMALDSARNPDGSLDPERREAVIEATRRRNPLRCVGEPLDVALAVVYLASDAARYVTGQVLHPNGGALMV